jgi:hypothetical protein
MTLIGCLLTTLLASSPAPAPASHLWIVNELFSNVDGTIQFIELHECCGSATETQLSGKNVFSQSHSYTFSSNLTGNTAHRYLLLATAGFAALSGAPTPDYIIPDNFFSINGDSLRWFVYPNATVSFTAGQLPLDGVSSLNHDLTTGVNSPTNWAGQSGSIAVTGAPALPLTWLVTLVAGAALVGWLTLRRTGG